MRRKITLLTSLFFCLTILLKAQTPAVQFTVDNPGNICVFHVISYENLLQIDWGDGNKVDLNLVDVPITENGQRIVSSPTALAANTTVKVYGDKIMHFTMNDAYVTAIQFGNTLDLIFFSELYLRGNSLTTLDLSPLTELTTLDLVRNNLTGVDLSANAKLVGVNVGENAELTSLSVSANTLLQYLDVSKTGINSLDLTTNSQLKQLSFTNNSFSSINLSNLALLESLRCGNNALQQLDLSDSPNLKTLRCSSNLLTEIKLHPSVIELDELECQYNKLTLATLPRVKKSAANTVFTYHPQDSISLTERVTGMQIDLSDQYLVSGIVPDGVSPITSDIRWIKFTPPNTNTALKVNTDYTITSDGVYKFLSDTPITVYARITNSGYENKYFFTTKIELAPNPSSITDNNLDKNIISYDNGVLYINSNDDLSYTVRIVDAKGKTIFARNTREKSINVNDLLQEGVYIISIDSATEKHRIKIIK